MISSTSSSDRAPRPEALSAAGQPAVRPFAPRPDQISTDSVAFLRGALQRQPEIRPDVVARARTLAADPSYPSQEVLKKVAEQILRSPDLTEDES
jgi:hypothetical protein